jgi:hypothetical protein
MVFGNEKVTVKNPQTWCAASVSDTISDEKCENTTKRAKKDA